MPARLYSPAEKIILPHKPLNPPNKLPSKVTKRRRPRESTASKISKRAARENEAHREGSTYPGGRDPFHAKIVRYGEPTNWTETRAFYALHRDPNAVPPTGPPDPQFYDGLPESPPVFTSGVDMNRRPSMGGKEFWRKLEDALDHNLNGEGNRCLWEFGGDYKRGIGSLLWEEREREEEAEEEREERELLRKMNEVEAWGG